MNKHIHKVLYELKNNQNIDTTIYKRFLERIKNSAPLTHEKNPQSHFCCFTLPIDRANQSIFLVHHIKADDWIPPGGHIDEGETPMQTVKRELAEELRYHITNESMRLFDLSVASIRNPNIPCQEHYDFWYAVETGKKQFRIDRGEFYDAGWFPYDRVLFQIKTPLFRNVIRKFLLWQNKQ